MRAPGTKEMCVTTRGSVNTLMPAITPSTMGRNFRMTHPALTCAWLYRLKNQHVVTLVVPHRPLLGLIFMPMACMSKQLPREDNLITQQESVRVWMFVYTIAMIRLILMYLREIHYY